MRVFDTPYSWNTSHSISQGTRPKAFPKLKKNTIRLAGQTLLHLPGSSWGCTASCAYQKVYSWAKKYILIATITQHYQTSAWHEQHDTKKMDRSFCFGKLHGQAYAWRLLRPPVDSQGALKVWAAPGELAICSFAIWFDAGERGYRGHTWCTTQGQRYWFSLLQSFDWDSGWKSNAWKFLPFFQRSIKKEICHIYKEMECSVCVFFNTRAITLGKRQYRGCRLTI